MVVVDLWRLLDGRLQFGDGVDMVTTAQSSHCQYSTKHHAVSTKKIWINIEYPNDLLYLNFISRTQKGTDADLLLCWTDDDIMVTSGTHTKKKYTQEGQALVTREQLANEPCSLLCGYKLLDALFHK